MRKFSLDGKYLIAFSQDQASLEIYEFKGIAQAQELLNPCTEEMLSNFNLGLNHQIRSKIFDCLFKKRHVVKTACDKQLNRECSLFTHDYNFVICGGASFVPENMWTHYFSNYPNNECITPNSSCPLEDYTIYCIDLLAGKITDSIHFNIDKIILSHNQGLYLYYDTLAILSILKQTIHLYHVKDGKFTLLRRIGRFCSDEEECLCRMVPDDDNNGDEDDEDGDNNNEESHSDVPSAFQENPINSLKHKILVFLFKQAQNQVAAGDTSALQRFFQRFDYYKDLRIWKMQLLDQDYLLLKYATEDVVTLRAHDPNAQFAFFVFYNIWTCTVEAVYNNRSEELLFLYENFQNSFRNVRINSNHQHTSSSSNNVYVKLMHERFKRTLMVPKATGPAEATKRLLAQLPISAQSYSVSPYLDLSLWSFDDKWVSSLERPKACGEFPIRFFARDSGILKFRLHTGNQQKPTGNPSARRLVAFSFHPTEPFAVSVQRVPTTPTDYIANFHIRHVHMDNAPSAPASTEKREYLVPQ